MTKMATPLPNSIVVKSKMKRHQNLKMIMLNRSQKHLIQTSKEFSASYSVERLPTKQIDS